MANEPKYIDTTMDQLTTRVQAFLKAKTPVMIWGPAGVGKSQGTYNLSQVLGGGFVDMRCNLYEPVDLQGIPAVFAGTTVWNPPALLPNIDLGSPAKGILFLDELPNAHPSTQSALYQLVLDRKLGTYHLPDGWSIVAAGNRLTDGGGTFDMPTPLKDRFAHLSVEPNAEAWRKWALGSGHGGKVTAFIDYRPSLLHNVDHTREAFPTPRSWEAVSRFLQENGYPGPWATAALVGDGAAAEFDAFMNVWSNLPSYEEMLKHPKKAIEALDGRADRLYAVIGKLLDRLSSDNSRIDEMGALVMELDPEWKQVWLARVTQISLPDTLPNWLVDWLAQNQED